MGLSLKTAAERFAQDQFSVWDPATDTFSTVTIPGKRFRLDRFTTIYHRPTRRSYIRLLDGAFPASGVVRREGVGEIYLLSETLGSDVANGDLRYEKLRMGHLVTPPSGGKGTFIAVRTTGTGTNLGPVDLSNTAQAYLDLELQSATAIPENIDSVTPRFLLNHSSNVQPLHGDIFTFQGRDFLVSVPYVDGGLHIARVSELPPAYDTFTYHLRSSTGGYNPATGAVTSPVTQLQFSGIIGRKVKEDTQNTAPVTMELYVYEHHVGFRFEVGNQIDQAGTKYYIRSVVNRREEKQWFLELTR